VLGVRFHERRSVLTVGHRAALAVLCGVAGVGFALMWTPPDTVVNNSYVLSAITGLGWLLAFLALERPINNLALIPGVSRVVMWFTGVSMSVYLWHTLAICLAYWIVGEPQGFTDVVGLLVVSGALVWFVVRATQPIEQRTNGAKPVVHRRTTLALGAIALLLASQSSLFPQLAEAAGPPAPSGRPPVGADAEDVAAAIEADGAGVEGWLDQADIDYSAVAIDASGRDYTFTRGEWSEAQVEKPFEVMSISKTMIAAVALRYVEEGRLSLDGPLPDAPTLPDAVVEKLTLRRLLAHATGLADYRDAPDYREDRPLTREEAVAGAASVSDLSSLDVDYASTNYIATGLLLEHLAGEPLDEILKDELFDPLGLSSTRLVNNDRDGFVGHGSAGVVSTMADIARWYDALYRERSVLSTEMLDQMLLGGREFSDDAGLGSWRHCPCRPPSYVDPTPWYYSYHDGGDVRLLFMPDLQLTVAIRVSVPLYGSTHVVDVLDALVQAIIDQMPTAGPPR
jgi:CubicO group peptidase (beta-lactamase class C family)